MKDYIKIVQKMSQLSMYESFENGEYIEEKNISLVANYISGNLICWSPNHSYWYTQNIIMLQNYIMFVGGEKKEDFPLL